MAWPPGKHLETLIKHARQVLTQVQIIRYDVSLNRALIDLEGQWDRYRIIVSEIHRADSSIRYAYYVLNESDQLLHGFDNSPDTLAVKLWYGANWKAHLHQEIPHHHDAQGNLTLTSPINFETFVEWLKAQVQS